MLRTMSGDAASPSWPSRAAGAFAMRAQTRHHSQMPAEQMMASKSRDPANAEGMPLAKTIRTIMACMCILRRSA